MYKAKDLNGNWVKGYLYETQKESFITPKTKENHPTETEWIKVLPYTTCKASNLRDKAGEVIYENDFYEIGDRYYVFFQNGAFTGGKTAEATTTLGWESEVEEEELSECDFCKTILITGNKFD